MGIQHWMIVLAMLASGLVYGGDLKVDDTPAEPGYWGFRPAEASTSMRNPPPFSWRPQDQAAAYELQIASDPKFSQIAYQADSIQFNVHCPTKVLDPGLYYWQFRYTDADGKVSGWSKVRTFTIAEDAVEFPLPSREELSARVPDTHPRLFVRPENMPHLRELAKGKLKDQYQQLIETCDALLKDPPPTDEPPMYREGIDWHGEERRTIWWGNRTYTIKLLNGAATLGFTYQLSGNTGYGQMAKKLLLEAAKWNPDGSTNWRYNDEAAMPYNYYFARTYTFVNDLLTDEEKQTCIDLMRIRGRHMYEHLHPRHLWAPYGSHDNRAWHFLGEVAIAFHGEIEEADDWLWFAVNKFANVYPVWSDDDGGWHEGMAYWRSYITRFTWWADVMRIALDLDAFDLPYFSKAGYYPMYLQPPNTFGGGFGDLNARQKPERSRELMTALAAQAGNGYWQWYVEQTGGAQPTQGYIGFIRGALPPVEARPPTDLPQSRLFQGIGQAMLNSNILDAHDNVQIIFKSSPFATQSHGYESQNSFLLYAFGDRMFIRTGRRDSYGSPHHKQWMWQTKSQNNITINGQGQIPHSAQAIGEIIEFQTSKHIDFVRGEAAQAYDQPVKQFTRSIVFIKPDLIVIHDRLKTDNPSTFQWHLHSPVPMAVNGQDNIRVESANASCLALVLWPQNLDIDYTDEFDPPPAERIDLTEYHLTASTTEESKTVDFITMLRPYRTGKPLTYPIKFGTGMSSYRLETQLPQGRAEVEIGFKHQMGGEGWPLDGEIIALVYDEQGNIIDRCISGQSINPD